MVNAEFLWKGESNARNQKCQIMRTGQYLAILSEDEQVELPQKRKLIVAAILLIIGLISTFLAVHAVNKYVDSKLKENHCGKI